MQHVIIGAGPAGVVTAETLRKLDPGSAITLIGDEPEPPYSRMAIPYYLSGTIAEPGTHLRHDKAHFDRKRIEILCDRVAAVSPERNTVTLASGRTLGYDRLLIATGARPVIPPIPGIDLPAVHACWTLEDARAIKEHLLPGAEVVLIGAGFIGCIVLEALARNRARLTVVEMEERMVPRMLNGKAAALLQNWCRAQGVEVLTSARVQAIERAGQGLAVSLGDGRHLTADLVISATGVASTTEFLRGSGIVLEAGVLVDEFLRTSQPNIYAAGDACQGKDFSTGAYSVQAIQPTASDHGRIAAANMAGRSLRHQGSINMNVLDTLGLVSSSFGLWMGAEGGEQAELYEPTRNRYLNLQFLDDVLVGACAIGIIEHVGVLRGLIQSKLRLKDWKHKLVKNPTRVMEAYLARTQPLSYNAGVL